MLIPGPKMEPYLILAQLEKQRGNYEMAVEHILDALKQKQDSQICGL